MGTMRNFGRVSLFPMYLEYLASQVAFFLVGKH